MTACASGCLSRDRHLDECPDPDTCGGCLPRQADDGYAVCNGCVHRITTALEELPQLWVDLAERVNTGGPTRYGSSNGDPEACPDCDTGRECTRAHRDTPAPLGAAQVTARSTIRAHLVTWCQVLADKRHITLPDETRIAATTRDLAHYESVQAAAHRLGADIYAQPGWDAGLRVERPPDPLASARHRRDAHQHAVAAARARQDRETGLDIVRALAGHVQRHLDGLLTDTTDAPVIVDDLTTALRDARRYANRSRRSAITIPCPECGARNAAPDVDVMGDITCSECGLVADATYWGRLDDNDMTEAQIVEHLATEYRIKVDGATIRQWATRGYIRRCPPGEDGLVRYRRREVVTRALRSQARRVG